MWMARRCPRIHSSTTPDDAIYSSHEAPKRRRGYGIRLPDRLAACKLVLHPEKTKIVFCKDAEPTRRLPYHLVRLPGILDFGPGRRCGGKARKKRIFRAQLPTRRQPEGVDVRSPNNPALDASSSAATNPLQIWPRCATPCIRGWINYYSNFYRTPLRSHLKRIDLYGIRWARRKFKRLRGRNKRSTRLV